MSGNLCGVYQILHVASGRCYVGSSVRIARRWQYHQCELRKGRHSNRYLQHLYNKYGAEAFSWSILELCPEEQLFAREVYWIEHQRAFVGDGGLTLCVPAVGDQRVKLSAETRQKMSERSSTWMKGRIQSGAFEENRQKLIRAATGRKKSPEEKEKIAAAHRGKPLSLEHRRKLSLAHLGVKRGPYSPERIEKVRLANLGKKRTPEQRQRASLARKGKPLGPCSEAHKRALSEMQKRSWARRRALQQQKGGA